MKKKYILSIFIIIVILTLSLGWKIPCLVKYFYQNLTNNSSKFLAISNIEAQDYNNYKFIDYDTDKCLSTSITDNIEAIEFSNLNDNANIYIQAFLYDSIEKISVYINNNLVHSEIDRKYLNPFSDKYYIVSTSRLWIKKDFLKVNDFNKIDYIIGNNSYSYYFFVK